ncbi:MAG: hypothetical protein ACTSYL_01015 [Candidatus Thorarchaeota archaeon]
MRPDMDVAFSKLASPRMRTGTIVLHALLENIVGPVAAPKEIRDMIEDLPGKETLSKQSITNAARRLEELGLLVRPTSGGYAVRYGYLVSVLVAALMDLWKRVEDLEDEVDSLKRPKK